MRFERTTHGTQVLRSRTAAAADDPSARIEGQAGVLGHELRRTVEADGAVDILRDAAIGFCDENRGGIRGHREIDNGGHEFRGADAAIAAAGRELVLAM